MSKKDVPNTICLHCGRKHYRKFSGGVCCGRPIYGGCVCGNIPAMVVGIDDEQFFRDKLEIKRRNKMENKLNDAIRNKVGEYLDNDKRRVLSRAVDFYSLIDELETLADEHAMRVLDEFRAYLGSNYRGGRDYQGMDDHLEEIDFHINNFKKEQREHE